LTCCCSALVCSRGRRSLSLRGHVYELHGDGYQSASPEHNLNFVLDRHARSDADAIQPRRPLYSTLSSCLIFLCTCTFNVLILRRLHCRPGHRETAYSPSGQQFLFEQPAYCLHALFWVNCRHKFVISVLLCSDVHVWNACIDLHVCDTLFKLALWTKVNLYLTALSDWHFNTSPGDFGPRIGLHKLL